MIVELCQHMSLRTSQKAVADHVSSNPPWLTQPAASARLCFGTGLTSQHGAVFLNGNRQNRATFKLIFEQLRDLLEVRFSPLYFIWIGLCENVLLEKLSRTPLTKTGRSFEISCICVERVLPPKGCTSKCRPRNVMP